MEFEDLGKHCAFCKQKDILPMRCNLCEQYFCIDHIRYDDHKCPSAHKYDNVVIVCKYCDQSVQLIPDVDPKIIVEEHLRYNCNPSKKHTKICPVRGCKQKLYAVNTIKCEKCGKEVCLKHRFPEDHNCQPPIQKPTFFGKLMKRLERVYS